eukprot:7786097-Pyramimonas_sp.AAC.1
MAAAAVAAATCLGAPATPRMMPSMRMERPAGASPIAQPDRRGGLARDRALSQNGYGKEEKLKLE